MRKMRRTSAQISLVVASGASMVCGCAGHAGPLSSTSISPVVAQALPPKEMRDGEVLALCTIRETASGVVHRLEFLFNRDLGLYEVDHLEVDNDLQESFRSYFAKGQVKRDRIVLDLQESVTGEKFAELKADAPGAKGLLLGKVVFTRTSPVEADPTECSVNN